MKLGVIGYGRRMQTVLDAIRKVEPLCRVAGIVDPRKDIELMDNGGGPVPVFTSAADMIQAIQPDGLLIGTRCSLHTPYALEVLPSGIPLFMEKPVSTTMEDWLRLKQASETYPTPVVVSHPLRLTPIIQLVKSIIDSGEIGTVEHAQAVNNVTYGGVYYHSWYRDDEETGGLFLQKATHDFDYLNYVIGQRPVQICAMTSKQVFKGNKPAGLKCVDCNENRTCEESTAGTENQEIWPYCSFAVDTGNEDSGSALVRYENGMHLSYSQNFFVRRQAASRGARFIGYKGTLEFDLPTGSVRVYKHHTPRVDSYQFEAGKGHFGGDAVLASNFVGLMKDKTASLSTLESGLLSALMCLKAKRSAETGTFQDIGWPETAIFEQGK